MEAIAEVNRGGMAGCSFHRGFAGLSRAPVKNVEFPYAKSFFGTGRRIGARAVLFEDQSHVQFYVNNVQYGRKDFLTELVQRVADVGASDGGVVQVFTQTSSEQRDLKKSIKKGKKAAKHALKKAKAGDSSSSSESSESESERRDVVRRGRGKRVGMEQMRKDWENVSQSSIMKSIPIISSDFVIDQSNATQEHSTNQFGDRLEGMNQPSSDVYSPVTLEGKNQSSSNVSSPISSSNSANGELTSLCSSNDSATPVQLVKDFYFGTTLVAGLTVPIDDGVDSLRSTLPCARVEVCMGGKCRRAGAEQVLSAFEANKVTACGVKKCMKNCKAAVNVRVVEEKLDTDRTRMYSNVDLDDVNAISQEYFGVGCQPSLL